MSKKNQKSSVVSAAAAPAALSHAAEYRLIRHDLVRVILLNSLYLAAVLVLYFTNQRSHYLDHLLGNWLHF